MSELHATAAEPAAEISGCLDEVQLRELGTRLLAQLPDELFELGYSDHEIAAILRRAAAHHKIADLAGALGCAVDEIGVDTEHDLILRDVVQEILDR
jgi:hypothetical protein